MVWTTRKQLGEFSARYAISLGQPYITGCSIHCTIKHEIVGFLYFGVSFTNAYKLFTKFNMSLLLQMCTENTPQYLKIYLTFKRKLAKKGKNWHFGLVT